MNYPIPPGTRDILPDEMRELRALSTALLEVFERFGYGEVWTPTLEYEDVLVKGDERAAGASYRLFDEHGQVLALRSDMTIPIARLVATRFSDVAGPLRLCYLSHAYRAVTPQRGQQREFLQAGLELIGVEAPEGTLEVIEVMCAALDAAGLPRARDRAGRRRPLPRAAGRDGRRTAIRRAAVLQALERHDFVELEQRVAELGVSGERRADARRAPAASRRRGGDRSRGRARRRGRRAGDAAPAGGRRRRARSAGSASA